MKFNTLLEKQKNRIVILILAVISGIPLLYHVILYALPQSQEPFLQRPAIYKECIRDTTYMRFHHMELLLQTRNEVMRKGKREDISIYQCAKCHPSREQFCNQCHRKVNLNLDCFDCHYYPEPENF